MKPFTSVEEFKRFLDEALKEHEKRNLSKVSLPILKKEMMKREKDK